MVKTIFAGVVGGFFGLCCAGLPLFLGFITGIGLGFAINDLILLPLLGISLILMFFGLHYNKKKHLSKSPIYLAILSTILIIIGIFYFPVIWLGIIGIFISTILDYNLIRKCKKC